MARIGKFLLFVLIILVCLEALVRLWGYSEMYLYDPIYRPCPESQEIPFVLKPNLARVRAHGNIYINTDALGLRALTTGEKYPPKGPHEYRIAFMGDSTTFGVGVATEDTYPEVVQADLNRLQHRYRVRVFNFAESSYSVKEMTATLKYRVPEISPNLVIMGIIINDFDTGRTPGLDKWGYNTHGGASALVNQYPSIKLILRNMHLSYIIRDILSRIFKKKEAEVELMQGKMPEWIAQSYSYVVDFKKIAAAGGYQYLVVTLPTLGGDGSQFREIIANFKRDQIAYYDLSPMAPDFTSREYRASRYDAHPSARVHREIAKKLSRYIMDNYLSKAAQN
ncbi:MAG: SGNH/GDSL hydrolase family protein [Syntrophales bacterium]|nr:SGNH/GDSL hydrolase family protein [Syntrophales bacterium]MDD5641927.1 SGNH/GDSL hydrolase family protein [Syntrophales bacterium]